MAELITSHRFQLARDCSRLSAVTVPNVRFVTLAASGDRKSTRLNSSHGYISYAVFCLKKKNTAPLRSLLVSLLHNHLPKAPVLILAMRRSLTPRRFSHPGEPYTSTTRSTRNATRDRRG